MDHEAGLLESAPKCGGAPELKGLDALTQTVSAMKTTKRVKRAALRIHRAAGAQLGGAVTRLQPGLPGEVGALGCGVEPRGMRWVPEGLRGTEAAAPVPGAEWRLRTS